MTTSTRPSPIRPVNTDGMGISDLQFMVEMLTDALDGNAATVDAHDRARQFAMRDAYQARLDELRTAGSTGRTHTPAEEGEQIGRRAGSAASNQFGTFAVHAASEAQVRFLAKLIAEKDHGDVKVPADLEGINKKAASALIDKLINRPAKAAATPAAGATTGRPASEKQIGFIRRLLAEKDSTATALDLVDESLLPTLTSQQASKAIDALMAAPRKQQAKPLAAGAYRVDDRIIRVYVGQQSGKMLAQELVDPTARDRADAWKYLGMAARFVSADAHRMTVQECEEASAGTEDHGWCCVCGRDLDDVVSVARGIGPVCRAKQMGGE